MERIRDRVAGLDVHKDSVTAAVQIFEPDGEVIRDGKRFSTMASDLVRLADWLRGFRVTVVGMEATGVYWRPVYYVLEDRFEQVELYNAQHVHNVPGRKTDWNDAQWLADVIAHGMARPSLVPPAPIRALRELVRHRRTLTDERVRMIQRVEKVLQDAGMKITSVASTVWSMSSRSMIEALCEGERNPKVLAELARSRMRSKRSELTEALAGNWQDHHTILARDLIGQIDEHDRSLAAIGEEITRRCAPHRRSIELLTDIPGIGVLTAQTIIAEIGGDITKFPTAKQLCAWAGVAPGNRESAGKHRKTGTRHGATWLRRALVEAAHAAIKTDSYFRAHYHRIARRRGPNKAIVAVAHSILTVVWHVLTTGEPYEELGADYYEKRRQPEQQLQRHINALAKLGYTVQVSPAA
jgi:transposase